MGQIEPPYWRALVSAHRGGVGRLRHSENTLAAIMAAGRSGRSQYVEFDVQRTADGEFVLHHDSRIPTRDGRRPIEQMTVAQVDAAVGRRVRLSEALQAVAATGQKAHLDLKFTSPSDLYPTPEHTHEVEVVHRAREVLADDEFVVTTVWERSVRAIRDWSDQEGVWLMVGLSVGGHHPSGGPSWWRCGWLWLADLFPGGRVARSRANLLVSHRHLARLRLLRWAQRHDLQVLVWTVDSPRELRRLLTDPRVWMVTTNFPSRA